MEQLEQKFTAELLSACRKAQEQFGCPMAGICKRIETYGGVFVAKDYIRRNRLSDGFAALREKGALELSMEALVVASSYGSLFTDKEVNACFEALCSANGYNFSK